MSEGYDCSIRAILAAVLQLSPGDSNLVFKWLKLHNLNLATRMVYEYALVTRIPLSQPLPPEAPYP